MTPVSAVSSGRKPSSGFCLLLLNLCCPPSPLSFNLFKIQKQLFLPSTQPRVPFTLHVQLLTLLSFLIYLKFHSLRLRSSSLGTNWQEEHRKYINHAAKELFTLRLETFCSYSAAVYETFLSSSHIRSFSSRLFLARWRSIQQEDKLPPPRSFFRIRSQQAPGGLGCLGRYMGTSSKVA